MSKAKERAPIVCKLISRLRFKVAGTSIKNCERCSAEVAAAPSTVTARADHPDEYEIVCEDCGMKIVTEGIKRGDMPSISILPGQSKEVQNEFTEFVARITKAN